MRVVHYPTESGTDPVQDWLDALRDRRVRAAVLRCIDRAALGNFGDHKPCREGVMEMRLDIGPGFRLYYFRHGDSLVVLLCAGDKGSQDADINKAIAFRKDYLRRLNEGGRAMSSPYVSHEEATIASFRKDSLYAAEYINAVLEDGDEAKLALALRRLASAFGRDEAAQVSQSAALYRTLSPTGNPQLRGLQAMLGALGMRIAVTPLAQR